MWASAWPNEREREQFASVLRTTRSLAQTGTNRGRAGDQAARNAGLTVHQASPARTNNQERKGTQASTENTKRAHTPWRAGGRSSQTTGQTGQPSRSYSESDGILRRMGRAAAGTRQARGPGLSYRYIFWLVAFLASLTLPTDEFVLVAWRVASTLPEILSPSSTLFGPRSLRSALWLLEIARTSGGAPLPRGRLRWRAHAWPS